MKRKMKIILSVLVLIIAAGAGAVYFLYQSHQYKNDDKKLTKIVDSNYQIKLPNSNKLNSNVSNGSKKNSTESKSNSSNQGSQTSDNTAGSQSTAAGNQSATTSAAAQSSSNVQKNTTVADGNTKLTANSIIAKYLPAFQDLEAQANAKVNTLTSYAISDYKTKKANGESISYMYFYSKYSTAGYVLEASTDTAFSTIYNALTTELQSNGFSSSEAQSLKDQYNQMKKSQQSSLLSQAMSHLK